MLTLPIGSNLPEVKFCRVSERCSKFLERTLQYDIDGAAPVRSGAKFKVKAESPRGIVQRKTSILRGVETCNKR